MKDVIFQNDLREKQWQASLNDKQIKDNAIPLNLSKEEEKESEDLALKKFKEMRKEFLKKSFNK